MAKKYDCRYTRYADDITISTRLDYFPPQLARRNGPNQQLAIGAALEKAITANGFTINEEKVRLSTKFERMEVTGLTINKKPNVQRTFVRHLQAMLFDWEKSGLEEAEKRHHERLSHKYRLPSKQRPSFQLIVKGKLDFLRMVKGPADQVYRRLRTSYERLDPTFKDLRLHNLHPGLLKATWIIRTPDEALQGTAFWLRDVGLVTCAHCVRDDSLIFRADDQDSKTYPITVKAIRHDLDIAVLDSPAKPELELIADFKGSVKPGDTVTIAGFPHYENGAGLYRADAAIGQRCVSPKNGTMYWRITGQIIAGNSGGPILNHRHRVIGIAATGADSFENAGPDTRYGVIPITDILPLL